MISCLTSFKLHLQLYMVAMLLKILFPILTYLQLDGWLAGRLLSSSYSNVLWKRKQNSVVYRRVWYRLVPFIKKVDQFVIMQSSSLSLIENWLLGLAVACRVASWGENWFLFHSMTWSDNNYTETIPQTLILDLLFFYISHLNYAKKIRRKKAKYLYLRWFDLDA